MSDYDPPRDNTYDPEFPLKSDGEGSDDEGDFTAPNSFQAPASSDSSTSAKRALDRSYVPRKKSRWSSPKRGPVSKTPTAERYCSLRGYSREKLYPVEQDLNCYPAWALSPYWPVYVSNFRLNSLDESERNAQIATFFACSGLLTRMIYIREDDDHFFKNHQSKTMLLDMLVYFTCKADADWAIRYCNKMTYYGHTLNVFPGRVPVYFNQNLTVRFHIPEQYSIEHTETPVELSFKNQGLRNITAIAKHSECELFVEFGDRHTMNRAVTQCDLWIPSRLTEPVRKQRFLEQDCKYEMMFLLQQNPEFIDMRPPENVLQDLVRGRLPLVIKDWEGWPVPKELPEAIRDSISRDKMGKMNEDRAVLSSLRDEVQRQKEIFFAKPQQQQNPESQADYREIEEMATSSQYFSKNAPRPDYREIAVKRQQDFEQKFAMIRLPNRNNEPPSSSNPANQNSLGSKFVKSKFKQKMKKYFSIRKKLLTKAGVSTLTERNVLFFRLLRMEKSLGKMKTKRDYFQCDELRTGLIVAVNNTNQYQYFSKWYSTPFPLKLLNLSDIRDPLDTLTPVFVSNFFAPDLSQKQRNEQIKNYFGIKGLSVYMVYLNENDEFYNSYLKHVHLLDMLIYFRTQKDADTAIECFHGKTYLGHKLAVYSGRVAEYYEPNRAVSLELDHDPTVAEGMIEQFLSSEAIPLEDLDSVGRFPGKAILMLQGKADMNPELSTKLVKSPMPMKQRYLEADVKIDLMRKILRDPDFLNEQPRTADQLRLVFAIKSLPPEGEDIGAVVWDYDYKKRNEMNDRIERVLNEWKKLQASS